MRKPLLPSIMLLSMLPLIAGGCVKMGGGLDQKVAANEQAIRQLNSQLSGVQPAQADTWSQVQALRQEVAGLRGDIDTLLYSLQAVGGAHQMADSLLRHDKALRQIESQMALELDLETPVLPPAAVQTPAPSGYNAATLPAAGAVDPLTGQPLAQPAAPASGAVDPLTGLPLGAAAGMTAGVVAGTGATGTGTTGTGVAGAAPLSPAPLSPVPASPVP